MTAFSIIAVFTSCLLVQTSPSTTTAASKPSVWYLSNDNPKEGFGVIKDINFYEDQNKAFLQRDLKAFGLEAYKRADKEGRRITVTSGTRVKLLAERRLRGPNYKEMAHFEIQEGRWKGQKAWAPTYSLLTAEEYAALKADADQGKKTSYPRQKAGGMTYDPLPGDRIYLAPQILFSSGLETVDSLIYVVISDAGVYREWGEAHKVDPEEDPLKAFDPDASDPKIDAIRRKFLQQRKAFIVPINTPAEVQKVFPNLADEFGSYPVQIQVLGNASKIRVGWVDLYFASPRSYKKLKLPAGPDFPQFSPATKAEDAAPPNGARPSGNANTRIGREPKAERIPEFQSPSSSGICGAPTKDGTPCQRKVKGGGRCYQHR